MAPVCIGTKVYVQLPKIDEPPKNPEPNVLNLFIGVG